MVLCSLASPHQGALSRRVSSGPCPRLVQLLRGHKGCVLCKTEGQAVPSSPPPAPLLILSLLFCLSFPFLSIFGPGQPGAAFVLVLSGSPDLLPWFLFPFPEDGGLFFSAGALRAWGNTVCSGRTPGMSPRCFAQLLADF